MSQFGITCWQSTHPWGLRTQGSLWGLIVAEKHNLFASHKNTGC